MPAHAPEMADQQSGREEEGSGSRARKRARWDADGAAAAAENGVNGAPAAVPATGSSADALQKAKASLANVGDLKAKLAALRVSTIARLALWWILRVLLG